MVVDTEANICFYISLKYVFDILDCNSTYRRLYLIINKWHFIFSIAFFGKMISKFTFRLFLMQANINLLNFGFSGMK